MKKNPIEEGKVTDHGHGLGTVTKEMVWRRARELALIAGRPEQVLENDLQEARRELTGRERLDPAATAAESVPEEDRWNVEGETRGHRAPTVQTPDEQTFAEELVEEGVEEAEHDQMVQAEKKQRRGAQA